MKIRGCYWPDVGAVGSAKVQVDNGCDPRVAQFFPRYMVKKIPPPCAKMRFQEATEYEWRQVAKIWEAEDRGDDFATMMNPPKIH